jgi:hypothetical protein
VTLKGFALRFGLKQQGGVIPGQRGHFQEFNGEIWMKTPTTFKKITTDEEARTAIDEIGPESDWGWSDE